MHVHFPKPLHGWRVFVGEVGIIVIGVLIALAAEQVVEAFHWRWEAREFRKAVDREAGLNLGSFAFNQMQGKCTWRRLNELQHILERSRNGQPVRLAAAVSQPLAPDQVFSVWDNRDPQVFAHLPLNVRLKYAELYDIFRTTQGIILAQNELWKKFAPFEEVGPLTLDDRRQLHALISDARGLHYAMTGNWPPTVKLGASLGIKPKMLPEVYAAARQIPQFELCRSIIKT
jgi:hypothetical protein